MEAVAFDPGGKPYIWIVNPKTQKSRKQHVQIGRLKDPGFTIKKAVILTQYPGASAGQVELAAGKEPFNAELDSSASRICLFLTPTGTPCFRKTGRGNKKLWKSRLP